MTLFEAFRNDPFFANVDLPRSLPLEYGSRFSNDDLRLSRRDSNADQRLDIFNRPFGFMQNMMDDMGNMMREMETRMNNFETDANNDQGFSLRSSTVMSIDNREGTEPKIFQATSEHLRGPEGLERTRKGLRDTAHHKEKVEVAHRLGERAHRIKKELDPETGRILENREFQHVENEREFEREWFDRAHKYGWRNTNGDSFDAHTNNVLMSPEYHGHYRALPPQDPRHLAIEEVPGSSRY